MQLERVKARLTFSKFGVSIFLRTLFGRESFSAAGNFGNTQQQPCVIADSEKWDEPKVNGPWGHN